MKNLFKRSIGIYLAVFLFELVIQGFFEKSNLLTFQLGSLLSVPGWSFLFSDFFESPFKTLKKYISSFFLMYFPVKICELLDINNIRIQTKLVTVFIFMLLITYIALQLSDKKINKTY